MRIWLLIAVLTVVALAGCAKPPAETQPPVADPGAVSQGSGTATDPGASEAAEKAPAAAGESGQPDTQLSGKLSVGVPCGLAMVYKDARDAFKAKYPLVTFEDHVKNIGPMTKEVRDGKLSLDVFLSLGEREIKTLTDAGEVEGKPVPFLRQSMQLAVQLGNPLGIKTIGDLGSDKIKTVAIGSEDLTIGQAGEKALRHAGVWDKLIEGGKIVRLGQPLQTKQLVIDKKADATFIYAACSNEKWKEDNPDQSILGKADVVMTVPESDYGGMFAVAAVMADSSSPDLARRFAEFLRETEAQDAVAKWGYGRVDLGAPESKAAK